MNKKELDMNFIDTTKAYFLKWMVSTPEGL